MHNNTTSILKKTKELFPSKEWSFSEVKRADTSVVSHSYHRYPAKFIPQLVDKILSEFTLKGDLVLDPFGGCGTSLLESKRKGRNSIGFDVNPVAKLITDTKITAINPKKLEVTLYNFLNKHNSIKKKKRRKIKHSDRVFYWFDIETVEKLDHIYEAILSIENRNERRFFMCAFSNILKNCSRWLMKSIKPTIDKRKIIPDPFDTFLRQINSMSKKNSELFYELKNTGNLKTKSNMMLQDATKKYPLGNNSVDLIITSPPYVTSYEYADLHQLSLIWFADDNKNFKSWANLSKEFHQFRKKFVGSSYKNSEYKDFGSSIADGIISELSKENKALSESVSIYFSDMKKSFQEMFRVLKKNKKICVIIGNTELRGVDIRNAEVAIEQMTRIGFSLHKLIKREVSNKMITPWRDKNTGKFTSKNNLNKKRAYEFEYVLIMEK